MRSIILATLMVLALSSGRASADNGPDPIMVAPDQPVVPVSGHHVFVSLAAVNTPPALRSPRGSLIVYAPDGTALKPHAKLLRDGGTTFRVLLGVAPQVGSYTVFGTVEVGTEAFGMPTTFEVVAD